ncbi:hypothetical protein F4604DRAFT_1684275 [Suillus subluteus]|nr:hypothetical protein F4604DRAFT_1684275 [Suillus subluteus]
MSAPRPQVEQPTTSNLQVGTTNSQPHSDVVRDDQRDESSCDDGSEYDPDSCDDNHSVITRALVRALAERAKWDPKEIAAVFRVSLVIIQRTITNGYVAVDDAVSEDANYYQESELAKLILERPSPTRTREKKRGRKKQDKMFAKRPPRETSPVHRRQHLVASPPAPVPMEVEPNSDTARSGIFRMFRDEATLVHGEKVHSILEEIGIEDDETMLAVLTMDDERLNDMLQEAKRLNLVEKFSVIQAMRDFGKNHKIARVDMPNAENKGQVVLQPLLTCSTRKGRVLFENDNVTQTTVRTLKQELNKEASNLEGFTDHHGRNQSNPSCKTDIIRITDRLELPDMEVLLGDRRKTKRTIDHYTAFAAGPTRVSEKRYPSLDEEVKRLDGVREMLG